MTRRFSVSHYRSMAVTLGFLLPLTLTVTGCSTVSSVFGGGAEQAEAPPPGHEDSTVASNDSGTTESRAASTRARSRGLVAAPSAARADGGGTVASDGSPVRYAPYVPRQGSSGQSVALKPAAPPSTPESMPASTPQVAQAEPVPPPPTSEPSIPPRNVEPSASAIKAESIPDTTAPQVAAQNPPPVQTAAQARDDGPTAPPAQVNTRPPAPAPRGPMGTLEEQYQQRLAQSAASTFDPVRTPSLPPSRSDDLYPPPTNLRDEPIHLIPPTGRSAPKTEMVPSAEPIATFQVARVEFRSGSSQLTNADKAALREVAQLYKKERGQVRILSLGNRTDPWARADSIAAELVRLGVPAHTILVGADETIRGDNGATVFFDML